MTTKIKRRRWSKADDQFLIDNNGFLTNKEAADELGVTAIAVKNRRSKLGLAGNNPIYEVFKGYELIATGTAEQCAEQLEIKVSTLRFYTTNQHMKRVDSLEDAIVAFRVE